MSFVNLSLIQKKNTAASSHQFGIEEIYVNTMNKDGEDFPCLKSKFRITDAEIK